MKRFFSALLLSALTLQAAFALPFEDLNSYEDYFDAVFTVKSAGIFGGYDDGTFRGDQAINRAELAKVLVLATGASEEEIALAVDMYIDTVGRDEAAFSDVNAATGEPVNWYNDYVIYAKSKGWVNGYPDGSYQPGNPVKLAEALKMVVEVLDTTPPMIYADTHWYELYVNYLVDKDQIEENSAGNYRFTYSLSRAGTLDGEVTRAIVAELLMRVLSIHEDMQISLQDYADFGFADLEVMNDSFNWNDKLFDLHFENVPLAGFTTDEILVFATPATGVFDGYMSSYQFLYPDENSFLIDGYFPLFIADLYSLDYFAPANPYMQDAVELSTSVVDLRCPMEYTGTHEAAYESLCQGEETLYERLGFSDAATALERTAACLADEGVMFYGADWCSNCASQKAAFSNAASLPYVDCDSEENALACTEAGIQNYPTWIFPNEVELVGSVSVMEILEHSSCHL